MSLARQSLVLCCAAAMSVGGLLCLWAQAGPWEWAAAAQLWFGESYSATINYLAFVFSWMVLVCLLFALSKLAQSPAEVLVIVGLALPFVAVSVATVVVLMCGAKAPPAATLRELCEAGGIVPRTVENIPHDWITVLDVNRAVGVQESGQSWSRSTTYVPLVEENRLVGCVTLAESRLKDALPTTGTVAYEPLPYLVRRQFAKRGLSPPYATAVLHLDSGLVEVLLGPLVLAALVIFAGCGMLVEACKSSLRRKATASRTA